MSEYRLLLRDLRQAHRLSQEALARELGISRQSIISLEQGEYLPSLPLLVSLIDFFDCPIETIVDWEGSREKPIEISLPNSVGAFNLYETADKYIIKMLTPGIDEEQTSITVREDSITISADNSVHNEDANLVSAQWQDLSFGREIVLPGLINPNQTTAKTTNGLLVIEATKLNRSDKSVTIKINSLS